MKHITKGYVKVNDYYFDGLDNDPETDYNTDAWRRMVMCQEIGHIFGLGHVDEVFDNANEGTCMDYTDDPDGDGTLARIRGSDQLDGSLQPGRVSPEERQGSH